MYHGAEHKTIFCYEAGLPLTVENVRKQKRFHPRLIAPKGGWQCGLSVMYADLCKFFVCKAINIPHNGNKMHILQRQEEEATDILPARLSRL